MVPYRILWLSAIMLAEPLNGFCCTNSVLFFPAKLSKFPEDFLTSSWHLDFVSIVVDRNTDVCTMNQHVPFPLGSDFSKVNTRFKHVLMQKLHIYSWEVHFGFFHKIFFRNISIVIFVKLSKIQTKFSIAPNNYWGGRKFFFLINFLNPSAFFRHWVWNNI